MPDDSNSKDKNNQKKKTETQSIKKQDQGSSQSAAKRKKRTKDPNRHIADLAKKYSKLSQQISPLEDIIRKACPTYELERQLTEKHDLVRFIEESDLLHRELDRFGGHTLNEILGADKLAEQTITEAERSRAIFESLSRYHIEQIDNYHNLLYASSYVNEIIEDIKERLSWVDSIKLDPLEEAIDKVKDIIQIDVRDIFKISSDLKEFYSSLPDEDVFIKESGTIIYAGIPYDISEIESIVYESVDSSGFLKAKRITHKALLKAFNSLRNIGDFSKRNLVKAVLVYYFCRALDIPINYSANKIYRIYFENEMTQSEIIQEPVKKNGLIKKVFENSRIVTADVLIVREEGNQDSTLIGKLYSGDFVKVIETQAGWSLVEWKSEDGDSSIKGWVCNDYLHKIQGIVDIE